MKPVMRDITNSGVNYATAVTMPYAEVLTAAKETRYDIDVVSARFGTGFESTCQRLGTLQRPHAAAVPFFFIRTDRAGNISKRQSTTTFPFAVAGGTCPLWNVYETFGSPGKIQIQIAQMPDGRNYLWVARTVERRAARYGQPGKTFAIGIGCCSALEAVHALKIEEGHVNLVHHGYAYVTITRDHAEMHWLRVDAIGDPQSQVHDSISLTWRKKVGFTT